MKPIISPWFIYLAEKSEAIGIAFMIVGIFAASAFVIWYCISLFEGYKPEEIKIPKFVSVFAIVGILIGTILPSEKTVLTMMTVQQLTPDNIELAGNTIETTVDYIVDKIEEIIEEND